VAGALSSFAPVAVANWHYSGDWSGQALELQTMKADPLFRVPVNVVLLVVQNFSPPIFPIAERWNRAVPTLIPTQLKAKMEMTFEPGAAHFIIGEIETEEGGGLGFGVSTLLVASVIAGIRKRTSCQCRISPLQWAITGSTWFCLLVVMSKFGLVAISRIIAPYYLLLIPVFLLLSGQEKVVRARWWQVCALCMFALAALLVIVSNARPLWPAHFVLEKLDAAHSSNSKLRRIGEVFATYDQRWDAFAPARDKLPDGLKVLGLITSDDPETSLWRPFGSRRIEHVKRDDTLEILRGRGIQYVLVNSHELSKPIAEWMQEMHGEIVWKMTLQLKASMPPVDWYLVRVDSSGAAAKLIPSAVNL
jgi:hypothetical protein